MYLATLNWVSGCAYVYRYMKVYEIYYINEYISYLYCNLSFSAKSIEELILFRLLKYREHLLMMNLSDKRRLIGLAPK